LIGEKGAVVAPGDLVRIAAGRRWIDVALLAYARSFEHPMKLRFVRWLFRHFAGGRVQVRYASDAVVSIDPADYIGWAIVTHGSYEPASLRLALRLMAEEPGLFVDVGAHVGLFSCAVAATPGSRVIAVEADCGNCTALRANVALNRRRNVTIVNAAAGGDFAIVPIVKRASGNSGTVAVEAHTPDAIDWVTTVPLDQMLPQLVDPPVRPVLIKIDIEGLEPQVLAGLDFSGPFRPRNIIMECEPAFAEKSWGGLAEMHTFLSGKGYEVLDVFGRPLTRSATPPHEANIWAREV
jgi:FkbM family methyltransferase